MTKLTIQKFKPNQYLDGETIDKAFTYNLGTQISSILFQLRDNRQIFKMFLS